MGNSPSSGLGGGATDSSRDVRLTDPEKEVERPSARRAPTHRYGFLPAQIRMTLNDLECPIHLKVRLVDGMLDVR